MNIKKQYYPYLKIILALLKRSKNIIQARLLSLGKKMLPLSKIFFLYFPDYRIIFSGKKYYCKNGYIELWFYIISRRLPKLPLYFFDNCNYLKTSFYVYI